jgi:hypothetical protein
LAAELTPFVQALYDGEKLAQASQIKLIAALGSVSEQLNAQH